MLSTLLCYANILLCYANAVSALKFHFPFYAMLSSCFVMLYFAMLGHFRDAAAMHFILMLIAMPLLCYFIP